MANFDDLEVIPKVKEQRVNEEYHLQVAVIDHLTGRIRRGNEYIRSTPAFNGLFVTHIYQGRSKEDGFFLKQLGVVAGVADLLLVWRGGFGFIELKRQAGQSSPVQRKFQGFCMSIGVKYEIARSVKDVHEICIKWGLTPNHNYCKEPNKKTDKQIWAANHDFFARGDE